MSDNVHQQEYEPFSGSVHVREPSPNTGTPSFSNIGSPLFLGGNPTGDSYNTFGGDTNAHNPCHDAPNDGFDFTVQSPDTRVEGSSGSSFRRPSFGSRQEMLEAAVFSPLSLVPSPGYGSGYPFSRTPTPSNTSQRYGMVFPYYDAPSSDGGSSHHGAKRHKAFDGSYTPTEDRDVGAVLSTLNMLSEKLHQSEWWHALDQAKKDICANPDLDAIKEIGELIANSIKAAKYDKESGGVKYLENRYKNGLNNLENRYKTAKIAEENASTQDQTVTPLNTVNRKRYHIGESNTPNQGFDFSLNQPLSSTSPNDSPTEMPPPPIPTSTQEAITELLENDGVLEVMQDKSFAFQEDLDNHHSDYAQYGDCHHNLEVTLPESAIETDQLGSPRHQNAAETSPDPPSVTDDFSSPSEIGSKQIEGFWEYPEPCTVCTKAKIECKTQVIEGSEPETYLASRCAGCQYVANKCSHLSSGPIPWLGPKEWVGNRLDPSAQSSSSLRIYSSKEAKDEATTEYYRSVFGELPPRGGRTRNTRVRDRSARKAS